MFAFQKGNAVKVTLKPFLTVRLINPVTCLILVMLASTAFADFGAYYTKVDSGQEFERYSRTGPYADIVVNLNDGKFVFWRGSSYLPYWETDKGKWYVDELIRRKGDGPAEGPDKVNTYSRVIIAENSPDKAIRTKALMPPCL